MSSLIRTIHDTNSADSAIKSLISPSYLSTDGSIRLIPFHYNNGVLDLEFKADFPSTYSDKPRWYSSGARVYRSMGGHSLATEVGENFKTYIRNAWQADTGSTVKVEIPAMITKVLEVFERPTINILASPSLEGFYETDTLPVANYTPNNYDDGPATSTGGYVFKTPLTFSYIKGGAKKYVVLTTLGLNG